MKILSTPTFMLFIALCSFSFSAFAQKRINGNGKIRTITRVLPDFTKVDISLSANITINCQEGKSQAIITADENLLDYINTEVVGNCLVIDQIGWIEGNYELVVSTDQLEKITRGSWGKTFVKNIKGQRLNIEAEVGAVIASGSIENLIINNAQATVDASELEALRGRITSTGYGKTKVNIRNIEEVKMNGSGKLITYGETTFAKPPDSNKVLTFSQFAERPKKEVRYFDLKLVNNSDSRKQFRIEGPDEKPFGYGIQIMARGTRNERFPVGTKIFKRGLSGEKLLVTIEKEDEGKKVKLF